MSKWTVAGINFDHVHMQGNLEMVVDHPDAELVGVCDEDQRPSPNTMSAVASDLGLPERRQYEDVETCLTETNPDIVVLCPATAEHAEWVERVAPHDTHIILEKPFAATVDAADRIVDVMSETGNRLLVNWPLAWSPPHRTTKRLIEDGAIGEIETVHYYGGNRGPQNVLAEDGTAGHEQTWFLQKDLGGGSLLDYMGYGAVLTTWFRSGELPDTMTTRRYSPPGHEVDTQSVAIAEYEDGLSTLETRWGTFTNPWEHQTQPKCGFVVAGTKGTISSFDYEESIVLQDASNPEGREISVDDLRPPHCDPVGNLIHALETGQSVDSPVTPELNRKAQQILDTARLSASEGRTVPLRE